MNQYNPRDIPIRSEAMVKQVVIYENGVATVNYFNGTSELVKNVIYSDTVLAIDEGDDQVEYKDSDFTEKYKQFNHHHEMTDEHELVDFGDGKFIANKAAIPLLKSLADQGLRTRTHHVDENGGFVSILVEPNVRFEFKQVNERDSSRDKYNGMTELLISWQKA